MKCAYNYILYLHVDILCLTCVLVCFLQRLQAKVLKLVDISYGGENGFNQAIELSAEVLSNVKFIQEKKLIGESCCGNNCFYVSALNFFFLMIVPLQRAVL